MESGETVVVGVNKYVEEDEPGHDEQFLHIDSGIDEKQKGKLAAVKSSRDAAAVERSLKELADAIDRDDNLMPTLIGAVKCYATVGEICSVMRDKWGEYKEPSIGQLSGGEG